MSKRKQRRIRPSSMLKKQLLTAKRQKWRDSHMKRQAGKCFYCNCVLSDASHKRKPTLDHYIPLCLGGEDHFENTVAACQQCNKEKGVMHGDEFVDQKLGQVSA